jgi:acyl dehydratase
MTDNTDPTKAIGFKTEFRPSPFTSKDAVTYALGLGYSQDPYNEDDLTFTYELNDNFQVHPCVASIWSVFNPFEILVTIPSFPKFNPMMLLHGEQKTEALKPLDPSIEYLTQSEVADIADKGKGALATFKIRTYEKNADGKPGDCVLINTMSLFIRGIGGFGHKGTINDVIPPLPEAKPTKILEQKTIPNQALIYRLSGDINPLHVDTNMAQAGGFDKPILHGLCTYGISGKQIIQAYCNNEAKKLKSIKARFTSHVFPGETLEFRTWYDGKGTVLFEGATKERGKQVIVGVAQIEPAQKL